MLTRLLRPLSWLYGGITDFRNYLYDKQISRVYRPPIPTVSVGNLTVGGTGKTPMVDYILHQIQSYGPAATLSRGYGRRTTGFRLATPADTADTVGDEPLLLYRKHGPAVTVAVGEKRAEAIPRLLDARPDLRAIVLDDAYQHRPVQADLTLLLTDYNRLFFRDYPFPGGRLRERRHGARRADAVVVTKCPDLLREAEQQQIRLELAPYLRPEVPVFFAGIQYGQPVVFGGTPRQTPADTPFTLLTGIAFPRPLVDYLKKDYADTFREHLDFPDHYRFAPKDLKKLDTAEGLYLTTEKDFVKLAPLLEESGADLSRFFYLPIEVQFLNREAEFLQLLRRPFVKNS
ncbi:tetraacyldisaccharide 4'-kinase [Tellurirhabdus rosea]|uniref:tetraacyldisaccharide 4'-kinase n=1 Tax=Tellurirhabdus rosea TaxID=2674997 RepID=UPI0022566D41|nr:tetraacyldisaccharide 4'-kinase [Tellurirhabdus rosea]